MNTEEKLKIMADTVKPIINLLEKRMSNKIKALDAFDVIIVDDHKIKELREMEAMKLRHEINVLDDLIDTVKAMFPNV